MVVATMALLVALSGTAVAATPAVKRALFADNAGKLQGKTATAIVDQAAAKAISASAQQAGPASTAAGLVTVKTQAGGQIAPNSERTMTIACDGGAKIMGAGISSDGPVLAFDSYPTGDTTWSFALVNLNDSAAHNVSLYATCLK